MRIIFDNGEIADLENVHSVVVHNELEASKLQMAIDSFDYWEGENGDDRSQESGNESISGQSVVASESSEDAGQAGVGDL